MSKDPKMVGSKGVRFPSAYVKAFSQRGFALVLVLSFMVLITIVVIAYLLSATNQNSIARNVENASEGKRLSDVAVQVVMGQIRQATTGGTAIAWASQPGMIRTYGSLSTGTATASSQPLAYYKLYSSDNMVVTQNLSSYNPLSDVPSVWQTEPALFTDLNAPSYAQHLSASGTGTLTLEYPIIDPTAAEVPGASPNNQWVAASSPSASLVEGFSISSANTGTFTAPINYTSGTTPSATNNPAPMPVKWLFILRDGTVTAPTGVDSTGQIANWNSATDPTKVPSATNPIVARIAFWTDDETCKLNLNTAVGNTYWDAPMFETGIELEFSRYQPATNEFTRYPGHPSTTSLLPVLWSYGGLPSPDYSIFPTFTPYQSSGSYIYYEGNPAPANLPPDPVLSTTASNYMQMVMNLDPRNAWGGSFGGTVSTTGTQTSANQISFSSLGTQRLYASVDEMLFSPPRTSRATANTNQFTFTNTDINKLRFFLTTTSRAPEVNMFNLPKISMWPIHDLNATNPVNANQGTGTASRSPLDLLLAFCSTINTQPYYFQRNDPTSSTADLSTGTSGGTRNLALYKYLETMLSQNIPGFGASFSGRYGTLGDEQILTECYDYIRSTINLVDGSSVVSGQPFKYAFTTPPGTVGGDVTAGTGQVVPIVFPTSVNAANTSRGIGRFPTLKQVALMFIARAANQPPLNVNATTGNVIVGAKGVVTPNPMHPWVGNIFAPAFTGTLTQTGSAGSYTLSGMPANTVYPTISGQTHAGLPYLTTMDPSTGNYDTQNPRYPGYNPSYPGCLPTNLGPYQTQIQAMLLLDPVNVAVGFVPLGVNYRIKVTGLSGFTADSKSLGFTDPDSQSSLCWGNIMGDGYIYGIGKIEHTISRTSDSSGPYGLPLNFVSAPVIVGGSTGTDPTGQTFQFSETGTLTIQIQENLGASASPQYQTVQTIYVNFPSATFPTPLLPIQPPQYSGGGLVSSPQAVNFPPTAVFDLTPSWMLTFDAAAANPLSNSPNWGTGLTGTNAYPTGWSRLLTSAAGNYNHSLGPFFFMAQRPWNNTYGGDAYGYDKLTADTVRSLEAAYGDTRVLSALATVPSSFFVPHKYYFDTTMRSAHSFRGDGYITRGCYDSLSQGGTVGYLTDAHTRTEATTLLNYMYEGTGIYSGAWQQSAYLGLPTTALLKIQNLPSSVTQSGGISTFPETTSTDDFDDVAPGTTLVGGATTTWNNYWNNSTTGTYLTRDFTTVWNSGGDFDNGPNHQGDGPYINKPDESFSVGNNNLNYPDFDDQNYQANGTTFFPPNRQVPSSVMFGSLPVFIDNSITSLANLTPNNAYFWRTLLFSPNPNSQGHPSNLTVRPNGSTIYSYTPNPPDFAFLDFFNMPAVQPYAISEPFSTAGRVNMNYQIAPFTYIKRDTAMRGVLRSTLLTAVPDDWMQFYKSVAGNIGPFGDSYGTGIHNTQAVNSGFFTFRYPIHPTQTLQQFDAKFATGDIFRSPSEISSIWLYPATQPTASLPTNPATALVTDTLGSTTNIQNWWYANPGATITGASTVRKSITGTNMRDRPYANIYPQLTTKSNSYTVHYRVQVLKKVPTTPANEWIENQDQIYSEYRGSSLIERYIDPNNTGIPDFATAYPTSIQGNTTPQALDNYYYYHVLSVRKFSP